MSTKKNKDNKQPNFLILCMDQWQTHMDLPDDVELPALQRLESQGVSFDRHYCTVPICTPSRATMWTGVHAKKTGLWDNTNFAWIDELSTEFPTVGHMLRDQGYYTAFKGKWHCSELPMDEDALERYGFSDYQQWGEMFGAPLQGEMLDGAATFETVDWLENKASELDQPWLLVSSLINPHDVMFLQTDPVEEPHPNGSMKGLQTKKQKLGWFEQKYDISLPDNFDDDYALQPEGVKSYKDTIDYNYGKVPDDREDLWLERRNYLVNAMRLVDAEFQKTLDAMDRLNFWDDTIVILLSDHGEMNAAHRMSQKGAIHYDEAAIVNFTAVVPDGPEDKRTAAIGSLLDLVPTLLEFSGLDQDEINQKYPQLKGRSLKSVIYNPDDTGPRGSEKEPGDGALYCWDGLNMLDPDWGVSGVLQSLTDMGSGPRAPRDERLDSMEKAGREFGAPDFNRRTFYRTVVDGQYKLVRWFSPTEYGNPSTLGELPSPEDITLHDLVNDPGEMENIGHPNHPDHDPALVERMLGKLNFLIEKEIGEDKPPFDLDMFGTREVKYQNEEAISASGSEE